MKTRTLKSDSLLLLGAMIWGFAFVAQRVGMEYVGPFIFNGVRFALGAIVLFPFLFLCRKRTAPLPEPFTRNHNKLALFYGGLAGLAIFLGASFQQMGLVHTTAGKAGFITGLYVILVPILGFFRGLPSSRGTWLGALLATAGLYFLSVTGYFTIAPGDLLVLVSAFFWAIHVLLIGWLASRMDAIRIAFLQFMACSALSLITAIFVEEISLEGLLQAGIPILYAGILSVGVAYTLQVVAQKEAHPAHAAIILSLEGVFAVIGGWLILSESLSSL